MATAHHEEKHFRASESVRDVVIGMSDGLTVPFALAAGLSGAVDSARVVIVAGLAEIAAGSIAMGLGGYLAARTDAEHYATERQREAEEVRRWPDEEIAEAVDIFAGYGVSAETALPVIRQMASRPHSWLDFLVRFELGLEEPDPGRALRSALSIATSYVVGGMVPLSPYFFSRTVGAALAVSVGVTLVALAVFGYVKGRLTGAGPLRSSLQTALVGGVAAAVAFALARLIAG
jgi:VIT1/CCC1 family predicted Fe2+/Mn2+ transporter